MGTGPWQVDSLDPTKGAQLSANQHWWGGKVPIQRISFQFFSSESSLALAFRAGEIDIDTLVSDPKSFAASSGTTPLTTPSCDNGYFSMNTTEPGMERRPRQARRRLRAQPRRHHRRRRRIRPAHLHHEPAITARLGCHPSPDQRPAWLGPALPVQPRQGQGRDGPVRVPARIQHDSALPDDAHPRHNPGHRRRAGQDRNSGAAQGTPGKCLAIRGDRPADGRGAFLGGGGCFQPDPNMYSDFLGSINARQGSWNSSEYTPAAVDSLLAQGISTTNPAQRFAVYSQLLRRLQTDEPYVGLYTPDKAIALSAKFSYPGFSQWYWHLPWALNIKPAT